MPRTGGYCGSDGMTVFSLANSSGMIAMPAVMCSPCVNWYSLAGCVGNLIHGSGF